MHTDYCHRHSFNAEHELCLLNKSSLRSSVLQVQLPLGRRFAPTPAPASAVPASALAPAAVSRAAGLSSTASAPLTAAAPGPAVPASAPAQAPAAALAPAAASEKAFISTAARAPAPAAVSNAVANATAATAEAQQTTRELYNTQVRTWHFLSLWQVSLLLLSCIAYCEPVHLSLLPNEAVTHSASMNRAHHLCKTASSHANLSTDWVLMHAGGPAGRDDRFSLYGPQRFAA